MSNRQERRRFNRHRGTGDRIDIRPLGQTPGLEVKLGAVLMNISEGGLCLSQDIQWREEQVLRLVLPISHRCITIPTLGEVRWVKRSALNDGKYRIGVQYLI